MLCPAQLQFDNQLDKFKKVLPFVSEVKLASLSLLERGNMNAVVQHISDFGKREQDEQADKIDGGTRVIDLTENETERFEPVATSDNLDLG